MNHFSKNGPKYAIFTRLEFEFIGLKDTNQEENQFCHFVQVTLLLRDQSRDVPEKLRDEDFVWEKIKRF